VMKAPSSVSKRNAVFRLFLSGPWQAKHLSERIGKITRLNSIVLDVDSGLEAPDFAVTAKLPWLMRKNAINEMTCNLVFVILDNASNPPGTQKRE
jgi:hypothetical protein